MELQYRNITKEIYTYQDRIKQFLDELNEEKKYFKLTLRRILRSVLVIISTLNDQIVGITGLEKKWGIIRGYVVVKNQYQGMRIAETLFKERMRQSSGLKCNLIMAVVEKGNTRSINHCISRGYRTGGRWGNLLYYFLVLNYKGYLQYILIRILFPFLKLTDTIR
jgi:phage-related holin